MPVLIFCAWIVAMYSDQVWPDADMFIYLAITVVATGDPRLLGFDVEAMIGVCVDGDPLVIAEAFGKIPEVMNVMISAGRFSLMVEVICKSNYELQQLLTHQIRLVEGVRSLETFIYLECTKDSYNWCNP